jgi:hypothetical protein
MYLSVTERPTIANEAGAPSNAQVQSRVERRIKRLTINYVTKTSYKQDRFIRWHLRSLQTDGLRSYRAKHTAAREWLRKVDDIVRSSTAFGRLPPDASEPRHTGGSRPVRVLHERPLSGHRIDGRLYPPR